MSYTLNGIDLKTDFNFYPGKQDKSNIALSGFLDMPARLGKCFHDWGMIHGVEPYTSPSEIRFGGRDISLTGVIIGSDKVDRVNKFQALYTLINSLTDLAQLSHEKWGSFQVYVNSPIQGERIGNTGLRITIPFREPIVDVSGTIPTSDGDYGFDGSSFQAFGSSLISFTGDRWNRPAPKSTDLTSYYYEGYSITKTEGAKLNMKIFIKQPSFTEYKNKIKALYALFSAPGERNLIIKDDLYRRVFACSGFKVSELNSRTNLFFGFVDIELMQAGLATEPTYLGDNLGNYITDNLNNKLLISWQ